MRNHPLTTLSFVCFLAVAGVSHAGEAADARSARSIAVEVRAPDGGWVLAIDEVWKVDNQLVVVAKASRPENLLGARMVCTIEDTVSGAFPDLPARYVVLGKTWKNPGDADATLLDEKSELYRNRRKGERLFKRRA